jgi:hypothetical protein
MSPCILINKKIKKNKGKGSENRRFSDGKGSENRSGFLMGNVRKTVGFLMGNVRKTVGFLKKIDFIFSIFLHTTTIQQQYNNNTTTQCPQSQRPQRPL